MKCEDCGTELTEYKNELFCPKCGIMPHSYEDLFVKIFLKALKLKTPNGEKEAIKHLRSLCSISLGDSRCHTMRVDFTWANNLQAVLNVFDNAFKSED